ncbi:MAG: tRNA (cytidine(34)-2'-O)-methyltransferase [Lentisphaerae bacterium]|jgi:tRNA (cytidine/uridine-2'-O-)-methyltransferase|nr:tRNA (cytidine(34)-2'-O)-methyltransferase [Lentisphaerota bacterium]MBT4819593.1 tRNA (cytidine(34)-2'-O)-methyltransferase [Lentisphaerota bacterium]MBT5610791.1 tRNA (cytidine(34)-2'-O)-methyltransferase [Lentisphaerota bacterium]MBT7053777.1 tRNA (cytidine(34)-2'-O)-methyltransferase [Lentisphaerota bacterium]MBT7841238.1 tRNA (cytidine(34)-2'-O)-methyltransferase [Lentisphaerota bacterium]
MFNIVLFAPEIPQNTGTIGRLCVCTDASLHLIRPLGFSLDESRIRRAGLDYWQYLDLHVHDTWDRFLTDAAPERMFLLTTKATRSVYDCAFREGDFLIFGQESSGLPAALHATYSERRFTIPMPGEHARSHNLANAVSIVLYEGLRQVRWGGM